MFQNPLQNRLKKFQRWTPIAFFILGFAFDAVVLSRPDNIAIIVHQALYIIASALLIGVEFIEEVREFPAPRLLSKMWKHRLPLLHFLMGTLLNAYTIFFFKSASALTSFVFVSILVAILILNEFKHFGKFQTQFHAGILSLCVICYFAVLAPLALGFIGFVPFFVANCFALAALVFFYRFMARRLGERRKLLRSHLLLPFFSVQFLFVLLYVARVVPPVPLSATYMGIFHDVKRVEGEYWLTYHRSEFRFWEHGDQSFKARPGDVIHFFVRIFAPVRFKDQLQVRWLHRDPRLGWKATDLIPLNVVGGRVQGYRGVLKKSNYQPGEWRIQVETGDEREVGRITFHVESDDSTEPTFPKVIVQ